MAADSIFALRDSGIPENSHDYTTLIMIHGIAWHSGVFARFFPIASAANARIVLLNRRDYPGSARISDKERSALEAITSMPAEAAHEALRNHMRTRAQELYRFLIEFVKKEPVTPTGGLVLAGWSFGCNYITALLAESMTFANTPDDVRLLACLKRAVIYDPPYHALGYSSPSDWYNPMFDTSLAPAEGPKRFLTSGRNALLHPRATLLTISQDDMSSAIDIEPTLPGGSDSLILRQGIRHGLFTALRTAAVYVNKTPRHVRGWSDVGLNYVWCDHSVWEMPYSAINFQAELEEAKKMGKATREINIIRLRGANHFCHWDQPALALRAIIA